MSESSIINNKYLIYGIFDYLTYDDLGNVSLVSQRWRRWFCQYPYPRVIRLVLSKMKLHKKLKIIKKVCAKYPNFQFRIIIQNCGITDEMLCLIVNKQFYELRIDECRHITSVDYLGNVRILHARNTCIEEGFSNLKNVHTLKTNDYLPRSKRIPKTYFNLDKYFGFINMKNLRSLNLSRSLIQDVSFLGELNLYELCLSYCYHIEKGFDKLGKIHTLDLSETLIDSLDGLRDVKELILCGCYRIRSLKPLIGGKFNKLILSWCIGISDIDLTTNGKIWTDRVCTKGI